MAAGGDTGAGIGVEGWAGFCAKQDATDNAAAPATENMNCMRTQTSEFNYRGFWTQ